MCVFTNARERSFEKQLVEIVHKIQFVIGHPRLAFGLRQFSHFPGRQRSRSAVDRTHTQSSL